MADSARVLGAVERSPVRALCHRGEWHLLQEGPKGSQLDLLMRSRPNLTHLVDGPYVHRDWSASQRVRAVVTHYRCVEAQRWLQVPIGWRQILMRLDDLRPGLSLQIDRPDMFVREGELTASLFVNDLRIYSVVFLLARRGGRMTAYLGAIQGGHGGEIDRLCIDLTAQLQGCRPRDLAVLTVLFIANALGIETVYGVSDAARHHGRPGFIPRIDLPPSGDYDRIWRDHGGRPTDDGFFAIDTHFTPTPLASVPAKERAMHRRRYDMLARVGNHIRKLAHSNYRPIALIDTPAQ